MIRNIPVRDGGHSGCGDDGNNDNCDNDDACSDEDIDVYSLQRPAAPSGGDGSDPGHAVQADPVALRAAPPDHGSPGGGQAHDGPA